MPVQLLRAVQPCLVRVRVREQVQVPALVRVRVREQVLELPRR